MKRVVALFGLLRGSRRLVALSALLSLVQAGLVIPIGLLVKHVFDHTIPEHRVGELLGLGGVLAALGLGGAALALWTRYLVLGATKNAVTDLRMRLLERLHALPAAWSDRHDAALLHATVVQDSERIDVMMADVAALLVPAATLAAAIGSAMIVVNPLLCAILVPVLPVSMAVTRWLGRVLQRRTRRWHRTFDAFSVRTHFALRARSLVRAYGAERTELEAAGSELEGLRDAGRSMAWTGAAYVQANSVIAMVAAAVALVVGGTAVIHGDTTLGSLVSFFALAAFLRGHVNTVVTVVPEVISGAESLERLQSVLRADEPAPYDGTAAPRAALPLVVRDVAFSYDGRTPVLRRANLEIRPGECVAISGPNGAGKSTIARLILGFYRPAEGQLLAGDAPYTDLDVAALRMRFALVAQDELLFHGTIEQNIRYGEPSAGDDRIRAAARRAGADEFIAALPDGYATVVGDEGSLLAGGARQRIAIARALLREPNLLILDEPTTNLDRESAAVVLRMLGAVPPDGAILVISHDPAVIAAADRVYRIGDGVTSEEPGHAAVAGAEKRFVPTP